MKKILFVLLAIIAALSLALPAYADTADPDSTPTIVSVDVYRNLLETDDRLFVIYANIPYAVLPSTPVNETFIWRLIDTDGVTVLGTTVGYAYNDDGYGYNVFSMYFSAADALTWGSAYTIKLSGNPANFITPPTYNIYTMVAGDYTSLTDSEDNQAALAALILSIADDLNNKWALATAYYLNTQTEAGTRLSLYGEAFFRGAIYGVQAMAPAAFEFVVEDVAITDRTWTDNYTDVLENQYTGTWIDTARDGMKDLFSTSFDLTSVIILIIVCAGLLFANMSIGQAGDFWGGMVDVLFVLVAASRLGVYGLGFLGLIAAIGIIYIGIKIFGVR